LVSVSVMTIGTLALVLAMPAASDDTGLVIDVAVRFIAAVVLFCSSMIGSWLLRKRPMGPESELIQLWQRFANRRSKPPAATNSLES
jgi:hypothetical protein